MMKNLHNIEPSAFKHGVYVGYALGTVWTITGSNSSYGKWLAIPRQCDEATKHHRLYAFTLEQMSSKLDELTN